MTKKNITISAITIAITIIAIATVVIIGNKKSPNPNGFGTLSVNSKTPITLKTFEGEAGWGYQISIDTIPFIYQETIPGIAGQKGFASQEEAEKCGGLVLEKMKAGRNFSIKQREIDSLGISY